MARRAKGLILAAGVCVALALPAVAQGATITPNTTTDELNGGGNCSLREAVQSINAGMDMGGCVATVTPNVYGFNDLIRLNDALGAFVLNTPGSGENNNLTGDLDILETVAFDSTLGMNGNPEISQAAGIVDRVLDIHPGATVSLNNLTVKDGRVVAAGPIEDRGANILFRPGGAGRSSSSSTSMSSTGWQTTPPAPRAVGSPPPAPTACC